MKKVYYSDQTSFDALYNKFYEYPDVIFVAKYNIEVNSYRHILASWSPVLKSIFDEKPEVPVRIEVPNYEAATITRFIDVIERRLAASDYNIRELLEFGKEYEADIMKRACSDILTKKIDLTNVHNYVLLAYEYELPCLKLKCIEFMNQNKSEIEPEAFKNFPQDVLVDILVNLKFSQNPKTFATLSLFEGAVICFIFIVFISIMAFK